MHMRFVFLTLGYHPDKPGGAYRYVAEVAGKLVRAGAEVYAVYPGEAPRDEDEDREGVKLRRFADAKGFFAANWIVENARAEARVREIAADPKPTLWVVTHAFFGRCSARLGKPYVSLFTGPWAQEYLFSRAGRQAGLFARLLQQVVAIGMRRVERRTLQRSARVLTISDYYVSQLPSWHPGFSRPVRMISGGVDLERFSPPAERHALRTRWGLASNEKLLLSVRRLDPRMGLAMLVRAFRSVPDHADARLWIAGMGSQKEALAALIRETRQEHRIKLLGFVPEEDLAGLYGAADCTIAPSLALEGFGLVLVESLACGTPVLGADSGAISEILKPLDPSLLFPSGSEAQLGSLLAELLQNPLKLPGRERCREYCARHFSWDRPARGFQTAFNELVLA